MPASAMIFYFSLGLVLAKADPFLFPFRIVFLIAAFAAYGAWLAVRTPYGAARFSRFESSDLISLISCGLAFLLWMKPNILYAQDSQALTLLRSGISLCLFLSIARFLAGLLRYRRTAAMLALGFIVVLMALRILVIYASPDPRIDVFVNVNKACQALLSGLSPYTQSFPDYYGGKYGYKPQFNYWPMHFIYPLPFYLLGDMRLGSIFADGVTAFLLYKIVRRVGLSKIHFINGLLPIDEQRRLEAINETASRDFGIAIAGAWLCFPISLHVIEQSWIEPALAMFTAFLTLALLNQKWFQAGLWIGIMCATKQFMPIVAIGTFAFLYSVNRKHLPAFLAGSLLTFLALMVPFAAPNPALFFDATITTYITRPARLDSLSLPSLYTYVAGGAIDQRLLAAVSAFVLGAGAIALLVARRPSLGRWLTTLILVFGVIVLFGKQAFCNYYALISFFVLVRSVFDFGEGAYRSGYSPACSSEAARPAAEGP